MISMVAAAWIATVTFGLAFDAAQRHLPADQLPAAGGVLTFLGCCVVFFGLISNGSNDLTKPSAEIEWLETLPASLLTLHAADWVWRTLFTGFVWAVLFPLLCVLNAAAGRGWWSVPIAIALVPWLSAVVLLARAVVVRAARQLLPAFLVGSIPTLGTIGLGFAGLLITGATLSNPTLVRALSGFASPQFIESLGGVSRLLWGSVEALDGLIQWTPWGAAGVLSGNGASGVPLMALVSSTTLLLFAGWGVLGTLLRSGPLFVYLGKSRRNGSNRWAGWPRGPISWELFMTMRSGEGIGFAVMMPVVMLLAAGLLDLGGDGSHTTSGRVYAFTLGWGVVAFGTRQARRHQGTIWLQAMLPQPLTHVFHRTARFWAGVGIFYVATLILYFSIGAAGGAERLLSAACAVLGLYFIAHVSVAYDALTTDLSSQDDAQTPLAHTMLITFLSVFCFAAIEITAPRVQVGLMVLLGAFTLSMWQKLIRYEPYLLDPTADAPRELALMDGALLTLLYVPFVALVQYLVKDIWGMWWPVTTASFGVFAAAVLLPGSVYLWWRKIPEFRTAVGLRMGRLGVGVTAGLASSAALVGYVLLALRWPWLGQSTGISRSTLYVDVDYLPVMLPLLVVLTPIFVEFLFRGLIYRSLAASFSLPVAIGVSTVIFVVAHPGPMSVPMVVLGISTAYAFSRTNSLIAPIVAHAIHNLTLVGIVVLMPVPFDLAAQRSDCQRGDLEACNSLGKRHLKADRVAYDQSQARQLFERACAGGFQESCWRVGRMIAYGDGGPKDPKRATSIWQSSCEAGEARSCVTLAWRLYDNDGDSGEIAELFRRACDLDSEDGCHYLALRYREGNGVEKDEVRAAELDARACELGRTRSCRLSDERSGTMP